MVSVSRQYCLLPAHVSADITRPEIMSCCPRTERNIIQSMQRFGFMIVKNPKFLNSSKLKVKNKWRFISEMGV